MSEEKRFRTKNGVELFTYENDALHGFFLSLFVRAGSLFETEETQGTAHFFEHVAIRNVNALHEGHLYELLDRYGLEFNATTYNEMIQFYVSGATENFAVGARILAEVLSPVILPKSEIDLERSRIKAEIREGDERNSMSGFTDGILYPDVSLRFPVIGTAKSVRGVTGKKLEEYRKKMLSPENIFFYATGNIREDGVFLLSQEVEKYDLIHGEKRRNIAHAPAQFGKRGGKVFVKNADFSLVRFNFDMDMTKVTEAETDLLYDILLGSYNSRFFIEMSEKRGLFYDVNGALERYINLGNFFFSFEVRQRDVTEAVKIAVDLLREAKTKLFPTDALCAAAYTVNAGMLYDDMRELNFTFAYDAHILESPYRTLSDRIAAYRKITPERIREVANLFFTRENCTVTVKGNKKKIQPEIIESIIAKL